MTSNRVGRRVLTIYVAVVLLAVFIGLGLFVRVPYVALGPGPTVNTLGHEKADDPKSPRVVEVVGAVDPQPAGHLNLTTVSLHDGLTLFGAIGMWFSSEYELAPREAYYPPDRTEDEVRQQNVQQMVGSEDSATLAAFNYLKLPTAVAVRETVDKGPAAGRLKPGDRITHIAGTPVSSNVDVAKVLSTRAVGDDVEVTLVREGRSEVQSVKLAARPDDPKRPFLGITMRSVPADPSKDIRFNVGEIGGPSAGLMMTLSVIDQMTPGDLTHGQFIAGTGEIDPQGTVGEIGGINHKIRAAKDAGATMFLVPAGNCSLAKSDAPDGIELVKVGTLTDATTALGTIGTDKPRTHC